MSAGDVSEPDPHKVLLHRVGALMFLVNAGELSLNETVDRLLKAVSDFTGPCSCEREIYERMCRRKKAAQQ